MSMRDGLCCEDNPVWWRNPWFTEFYRLAFKNHTFCHRQCRIVTIVRGGKKAGNGMEIFLIPNPEDKREPSEQSEA
jgi:hypothetical protein